MTEQIVTRKEAKALGLNRFFTGKMCKQKHTSPRRVSNGRCVACEQTPEHKQARADAQARKKPRRRGSRAVREKARQSGQKIYFTGLPCRHGHTAGRYVCDTSCVECASLAAKRRRSDKPEESRAVRRAWRTRNRAQLAENGRLKRLANPLKRKERSAKYAKDNKGKCNAKTACRRAQRKLATPAWADKSAMAAIYEVATLLTQMMGESYHVDHIVPLTSTLVCGLHCEANLQILPRIENLRKHNHFWPDM
jgi:hypothetical protein